MFVRYKYLGSCKTGTINKELSSKVLRLISSNLNSFNSITSTCSGSRVSILYGFQHYVLLFNVKSKVLFYFMLKWNQMRNVNILLMLILAVHLTFNLFVVKWKTVSLSSFLLAFSIRLKERGNENWAQMDEVRIMLDYSENCQIQSIS